MMSVILAASYYMYLPNIDISRGDDLKEYNISNTLSCEKYCTKNERCKGFIVSKNQNKCWLKDNVRGLQKDSSPSIGAIKLNGP